MAHAELCLVCDSYGSIERQKKKNGPYKEIKCHGCGGLGWIEVGDDVTQPVQQFPPLDLFPNQPSLTGTDPTFTSGTDDSGNWFGANISFRSSTDGTDTQSFTFSDREKKDMK